MKKMILLVLVATSISCWAAPTPFEQACEKILSTIVNRVTVDSLVRPIEDALFEIKQLQTLVDLFPDQVAYTEPAVVASKLQQLAELRERIQILQNGANFIDPNLVDSLKAERDEAIGALLKALAVRNPSAQSPHRRFIIDGPGDLPR